MRGVDIMATDDELDEIDLFIDDLGWPQQSNQSQGSGGWPQGGVNIPIPVGSPGTRPGQSTGSSAAGILGTPGVSVSQPLGGGLAQNINLINSIIDVPTKTIVQYVIVPDDGSPCLELCEQQVITPREIIGIAKFINTINTMIAVDFSLKINWSELMQNLLISRHFKEGHANMHLYDNETEVLYIFLFDDL